MSYLTLPNGIPDFGKAVISFWFRVQKDTLERVARETFEGSTGPRMFQIIPLLVFGEMFEGHQLETEVKGTASYTITIKSFVVGTESVITTESHTYNVGPIYKNGDVLLEDPSYIGINCSLDEETGAVTATLRIRLQTSSIGSGEWVAGTKDLHISNYSMYAAADSTAPTGVAYDRSVGVQACVTRPDAGAPRIATYTNVDQSGIYTQQHGPDSIEVGLTYAENPDDMMTIEPDEWHHLLFSFDVMQPTVGRGATVFDAYACSPVPARTLDERKTITEPCQVWIALDDRNRTGKSLDDPRLGNPDPEQRIAAGLGDNGVAPFYSLWTTFISSGGLSSNNWGVSGTREVTSNPAAGMPTYTYHPTELPSQGHALGIPGTPALVDSIRHVEMAELQMWTGVTLDTGLESNRRAFIDFERDQSGAPISRLMKPIEPKGTEGDRRTPAERILGKRPEVMLHGNTKWIEGYNTGSLGVTVEIDPEDGAETLTKLPTGQFTPVARIEKYKPEPTLEKKIETP